MDIPKPVLERLMKVFRQSSQINRVYLFGSRARGDNRYNSDIDLAVEGQDISGSTILSIKEAAALYKADVLILDNKLDEEFLEEFRNEAVLIYEQEAL